MARKKARTASNTQARRPEASLRRTSAELTPIVVNLDRTRCLFCSESLGEIGRAREHIFPQWLLREFNEGREQVDGRWSEYNLARHTERLLSIRRVNLSNFVNGIVCRECNNGWMSDLEVRVQRVVRELAVRSRLLPNLTVYQRRLLARWTLKTAGVLNHASNYHRLVPARHLRAAMVDELPDDICVVARQANCRFPLRWMENQYQLWLDPDGEIGRLKEARRRCYRVAFSIGHLVIGMAYWPEARDEFVTCPGVHMPLWPPRDTWRASTPGGVNVQAILSRNVLESDGTLGGGDDAGDYASEMLGELIVAPRPVAAKLATKRYWPD